MTDNGPGDAIAIIESVLAALIARGEIDVVPGEDGAGIEIQADQWTLAIEGDPPSVAFLAVDEEPGEMAEMAGALMEAIEPDDLAALRELDRRWSGALRIALQASGDPLSLQLATLLAEDAEPQG
jgi:hypothetical protein